VTFNLNPSGGRRRAFTRQEDNSMSERVVYHVVPDKDENVWKVEKEDSDRASSICQTKDEAIEEARRLAQNNPLSQVKVHRRDGTIQTEWTYGQDPEKYPG
jgi:cell division protein FtsN